MRGLRPIAEIQYLDYLLYALEVMSDDIATLQYRSKGGQKAPVIIRTRGHRLEGIWHSGSPMGTIIHAVRGMHVCVPRNMTQAAGMYNTLLKSDEPALVVEWLNGYRIKEKLPLNMHEFTVPLGRPDTLRYGEHATLVTYGSCCRVALEAAEMLAEHGIRLEIIDVQTLLPFDVNHLIVESLKETNRLVVLDEDVPGGASAFILQQVLEKQHGYQYLDSAPLTITAQPHRPAYGTDGDYFSKPGTDEIFMKISVHTRRAGQRRRQERSDNHQTPAVLHLHFAVSFLSFTATKPYSNPPTLSCSALTRAPGWSQFSTWMPTASLPALTKRLRNVA